MIGIFFATVPVEPDADEARQWLTDELSESIYSTTMNPLARAIAWFLRSIQELFDSANISLDFSSVVIILAIVTAIVVIAALILHPLRLRYRKGHTGAIFDDSRSTEELKKSADRALAANDINTAVVERFRVLVRYLHDQDALEDTPGLTAHEAMSTAAVFIPTAEPELMDAANIFDRVRYGNFAATRADHDQILALIHLLDTSQNLALKPETVSL